MRFFAPWRLCVRLCTSCCLLGLWVLFSSVALLSLGQSPPSSTTGSQQLIGKAKEAEQRHDFQTAARFYQDYLQTYPDDPEILQRFGLVNYLSNRFDAAIPPLAKALKLNPLLWGSALYLGVSYYRTGDFPDAIGVLKQALALKPDLAEAEFWLGSSLLATNQRESAIPCLLRASKNPGLSAQADDLLVKGYRKAAEDYYHRISTIFPDSDRVHLAKAQLLAWKGKNNQAVWEAREALKRNPALEGAHRIIADVYWQEKGFDVAAREFQAELRVNPLDPEPNLRLGEFWLAKGDPSKAVSFLSVAVPAHTGSPGEAYHFLGEAELAQRDYAKAATDLQRAAEENPSDPANHQLLAQIYRASGQPELAAKEEQLARASAARSPSTSEQHTLN